MEGDNIRRITARAGVDLPRFLEWNDLKKDDPIIAGQIYFLGKKRLKGSEVFHKVSSGESLWAISQKYGLKLKRLKHYNRIEGDFDPAPGTMLFLVSRRPKDDEVIAKVENPVEVNRNETFNWTVTTESSQADVVQITPVVPPETIKSIPEPVVKPVDSVKILQTNGTTPTSEDTWEAPVTFPANGLHTVKAGETLYGIAGLYNLTVMELVEWNDLSLQQGIKPGQILKLKGNDPVVEVETQQNEGTNPLRPEVFHEVKTSDTLYSIARQYNVTIKEIMEWNEKKDFSLSVGEKLKILRGQ